MNITEAMAVQTLLQYVIGIPDDDRPLDNNEAYDRAEEAAALLAERAHKALAAGLTADDVHDAWLNLELGPWQEYPGRKVVDVPLPDPISLESIAYVLNAGVRP